MALLDIQRVAIRFEALNEAFAPTQEVLMRPAQYPQPIRPVRMECEYPQQIIELQWQITDLETKQMLPPQWDHTELEQRIWTSTNELDESRRRSVAAGMNKEQREQLSVMTRGAQQSGHEVHALKMQLANACMVPATTTPAAPQAPDDCGLQFPPSPEFAVSDRTQLGGLIAQLRMVIQHRPARFHEVQSKMRCALNILRGIH